MNKTTLYSTIESIERVLSIPATMDYSQNPPLVINQVCGDCLILSCGCLISGNLAKQLSIPTNFFKCPVCSAESSFILSPCQNLQDLYNVLTQLKSDAKEEENSTSSFGRRRKNNTKKSQPNISLLSAFHEVFNEVSNDNSAHTNSYTNNNYNNNSNLNNGRKSSAVSDDFPVKDTNKTNVEDWISMMKVNEEITDPLNSVPIPTSQSVHSSGNSIQRQKTKGSFQSSSFSKFMSTSPTFEKASIRKNSNQQNKDSGESNKELLFCRNFPFYRKLYQYPTHNSNFFLKPKLFINTGISPSLTKLALLSEKRWEVFLINPDQPEKGPQLVCCGKSNGEYGVSAEEMVKSSKDEIIVNSNFVDNAQESLDMLGNWEHLFCKITDNLLIISGTRGFVRVLDLKASGKILYTYQCRFPIRCIDVSPDEQFISLGVTGKDKYTGIEQAFIILLRLQFIDYNNHDMLLTKDAYDYDSKRWKPREFEDLIKPISSSATHSAAGTADGRAAGQIPSQRDSRFLKITTFPFTLPYRDPINILQFSPNSQYLSVATALESRFLAISIVDPNKPVLVMKSQRKLDTSLESEGITDIQFFPDNRLMTLTSVSYNSVPVIIDTKITSISGPEGIARPKLLLKIDEVGHTIHKCCVSPRGDSIAYLDRSGLVYVISSPRMDDNDNKRIVAVTDVSNAYRVRESATMRFDKDGYKLYILDRKGVLTISDFTAGTVEDHSVTRCKIIN